MKKSIKFIALALALFCAAFAAGCKSSDKKTITVETSENKATLILGASSVALLTEEEYELGFVLRNSTAKVTFSSSDETVATVSENGLIKAIGVGNAVVSVKAADVSATCVVTVSAAPSLGIKAEKSVLMTLGGEYPLSVNIVKGRTPVSGTLSYLSGDTGVATVSDAGVVKAVSVGKTEITVSASADGKTVYGKIPVTVNENVWIDAPRKISATLADGNATLDYSVKDFSGDPVSGAVASVKITGDPIASVSGNVITPKKCGTAIVEISYGGIVSQTALDVSLGLRSDEYNLFSDTPALEGSRAGYYTTGGGWDETPARQPISLSLTNKALGGAEGNKLMVSSVKANGTSGSMRYVGVALPCRMSKPGVVALKDGGYNYLTFDMYLETYDSSSSLGLDIMKTRATNDNRFVYYKAEHVGNWYTYNVSIDRVIENYDALANGSMPLIDMYSEDSNNPYTVYFSQIKFTR